jgi:Lon protease-like protein
MARRAKGPPDRAALEQACRALKVFPLHGVVVLPGTPTPLHVFEPRYRALVRDALASDRILAVPTLVSKEGGAQARAKVHPVAGACWIEAEERHADGRYDILVRGLARVRLRLDAEHPVSEDGYRTFPAEVLDDVLPPRGAGALEADREALVRLVLDLAGRLPTESGAPRLAEAVARMEDPSAVADLVAAAAVSEPDKRLEVIEALDVARRLDLVKSEVAGVILMLSRGRTPSA